MYFLKELNYNALIKIFNRYADFGEQSEYIQTQRMNINTEKRFFYRSE